MARDVFYQSPGNPIQVDLLPAGRPELEMPYHPYKPADDGRFAAGLLGWFSLLTAAAMVAFWIPFTAQLSPAARSLVWTNIVPFTLAAYLISRAIKRRSLHGLQLPLACLLTAFCFLNMPIPFALHAIITAGTLGYWTWLMANHWADLCTASPMSRQAALRLKSGWRAYVTFMAALPMTLLALGQALPAVMTAFMLLAIPTFQLVETAIRQNGGPHYGAAWRALVSWLAYNRHDTDVPGVFQTASGHWPHRVTLTGAAHFLVATLYVRTPMHLASDSTLDDSLPTVYATAIRWLYPLTTIPEVTATTDWFGLLLVKYILSMVVPFALTLAVPLLLSLPVLVEAERHRKLIVTPGDWDLVVREMRASVDPIERTSLYIGRLVHDGSPLLVRRNVFCEHAHFLGDSGAGKTSRGLAPLLEQLISRGDCSVIVIDLKADSMELLGTLQASAQEARKRTGRVMPLKHFSNQTGRSTFAFNPLLQPYWRDLELYMRTDIQCGALGLSYGPDYGEGYYSSANAAVLYHTIKTFPDVVTYKELAERVGLVVANAKRKDLHPEIRKAGVHVQTILDRLGSFEALNVTPNGRYAQDVLDHFIDFTKVFTEPELHYFHLSSTLAPGSSPEIARLVTYSLLAAATQVERRHQVFLVIDEFQRMVARNIEYMLQLARSMGVGVILANQTMQDLRTSTADLIPPIEANCRYRQWFAVSSAEDRRRLIEGSGETVDMTVTRTYRTAANGRSTESESYSETIAPRLSINDILLTSDNPSQSIVRIARGDGYAQYGGLPFKVESDYHITEDEYNRRKATAWPDQAIGCFVPASPATAPPPAPAPGPVVTIDDAVGSQAESAAAAGELFDSFLQSSSPPSPSRRRKRGRK